MSVGDEDPGVPEALPRTVRELGLRLDPATVDRLWIFPPLVRGRKEWGLVAASLFAPDSEDDRRLLFTAPYAAERTGKGLTIDWNLEEQGSAPSDRLPRVMGGVVSRAPSPLGDPREVEIAGDPERFASLLDEWGAELLEAPTPGVEEA
jgi:hypothetical protein